MEPNLEQLSAAHEDLLLTDGATLLHMEQQMGQDGAGWGTTWQLAWQLVQWYIGPTVVGDSAGRAEDDTVPATDGDAEGELDGEPHGASVGPGAVATAVCK